MKWPTKTNIFLGIILFLMAGFLGAFWLTSEIPLLSPIAENPFSQFLSGRNTQKQKKVVYGFVPYWNLSKTTLQPELTHLAYFSLTIGPDGKLVTDTGQGWLDPGYSKLSSDELLQLNEKLKNQNGRFDLVISQLKNEDIETFLADPQATERLLQDLDSLILAYPINGINLDIEYAGEPATETRENMTRFVTAVRDHLNDRYGHLELNIDMYAAAASKNLLWEVEKIAPQVDYIIFMAYDFHRSSSQTAGPIAPLFDTEAGWKESINDYLKDFSAVVPKEKILLGVPFYGYEWRTTEKKPGATTYPGSGATASYNRVLDILANRTELQVEEHWDEGSLAPFITYSKDDRNYTITYENARSLLYKLEYVEQLDLAGIAIWSLGYEGDNRDLWDTIDQKITQ